MNPDWLNSSEFFWGAFGGFCGSILKYLEAGNLPVTERPDTSEFRYWVQFIWNPVLGAFVALAYARSGAKLNPVLAINLGIAAPFILKGMSVAIPHGLKGSKEEE